MATTAAVWFEELGKTIFIGMDGYPSHMVPELERIIAAGAVETVVEHSDYRFLGQDYVKNSSLGGIELPHGVLYEAQGEPLTVTHDEFTHAPMFFDGGEIASPDHKYTVATDGSVIAHHRY